MSKLAEPYESLDSRENPSILPEDIQEALPLIEVFKQAVSDYVANKPDLPMAYSVMHNGKTIGYVKRNDKNSRDDEYYIHGIGKFYPNIENPLPLIKQKGYSNDEKDQMIDIFQQELSNIAKIVQGKGKSLKPTYDVFHKKQPIGFVNGDVYCIYGIGIFSSGEISKILQKKHDREKEYQLIETFKAEVDRYKEAMKTKAKDLPKWYNIFHNNRLIGFVNGDVHYVLEVGDIDMESATVKTPQASPPKKEYSEEERRQLIEVFKIEVANYLANITGTNKALDLYYVYHNKQSIGFVNGDLHYVFDIGGIDMKTSTVNLLQASSLENLNDSVLDRSITDNNPTSPDSGNVSANNSTLGTPTTVQPDSKLKPTALNSRKSYVSRTLETAQCIYDNTIKGKEAYLLMFAISALLYYFCPIGRDIENNTKNPWKHVAQAMKSTQETTILGL